MSTNIFNLFGFLFVVLRAATLCFQTISVGGIIFVLVVARGVMPQDDVCAASFGRVIRWSSCGFVISECLFVIATTFVLRSSTNLPLRDILTANYLVAAWVAIIGGIGLLLWPLRSRNDLIPFSLLPGAMMIAASVMTSHSASRIDSRAPLLLITSIHYLGTSAWIGGLPYLYVVLRSVRHSDVIVRISRRFSAVAQISVALLFVAGLCLSVSYVGSWKAVYGTAYGVMVVTKVVLFGCLLMLGSANYFLVRAMVKRSSDCGTKANLIRFIEAEIGIGLTVICVAASLTSQPPAIDLSQNRVSAREIVERYKPRMPRFSSPNIRNLLDPLDNSAPTTSQAPSNVSSAQARSQVKFAVNIAWSEYNHNWAGAVVFVMGILALLSRNSYFGWAKIWPLIFFGLAAFLFLRADPENWPLGSHGFWQSFGYVDVLQHRIAVILIIVFAIFQWRVETEHLQTLFAPLVFPLVCAFGGLVLLTHMHGFVNLKEELLVELSHTPIAILGVMAGWARWLEIRLPSSNQARKYLAWVWPICFILIGLILMDYHEM